MMLSLLATTVVTSAADSINPIAIAQQFTLQSMVKKTNHIWYFIIAIGITNFLGGVLAYFGIIEYIAQLFQFLFLRYNQIILFAELIMIGVFVCSAVYLVIKEYKNKNQNQDLAAITQVDKSFSVTPISLILLGVVATLSELTTAIPYFAFLAVLFSYQLSFIKIYKDCFCLSNL